MFFNRVFHQKTMLKKHGFFEIFLDVKNSRAKRAKISFGMLSFAREARENLLDVFSAREARAK